MKLSVKDRIMVKQFYPNQDDLVTQVLVRDIAKKVEFSQKELEEIEYKVLENGNQTWKEKDIDVKFTDSELSFLRDQGNRLNSEKKISQDNLDLCLKIKR